MNAHFVHVENIVSMQKRITTWLTNVQLAISASQELLVLHQIMNHTLNCADLDSTVIWALKTKYNVQQANLEETLVPALLTNALFAYQVNIVHEAIQFHSNVRKAITAHSVAAPPRNAPQERTIQLPNPSKNTSVRLVPLAISAKLQASLLMSHSHARHLHIAWNVLKLQFHAWLVSI